MATEPQRIITKCLDDGHYTLLTLFECPLPGVLYLLQESVTRDVMPVAPPGVWSRGLQADCGKLDRCCTRADVPGVWSTGTDWKKSG